MLMLPRPPQKLLWWNMRAKVSCCRLFAKQLGYNVKWQAANVTGCAAATPEIHPPIKVASHILTTYHSAMWQHQLCLNAEIIIFQCLKRHSVLNLMTAFKSENLSFAAVYRPWNHMCWHYDTTKLPYESSHYFRSIFYLFWALRSLAAWRASG